MASLSAYHRDGMDARDAETGATVDSELAKWFACSAILQGPVRFDLRP